VTWWASEFTLFDGAAPAHEPSRVALVVALAVAALAVSIVALL
jgi:hypothetical protein